MSRYSASPIVAAFAAARSENQDVICLLTQEVAELIPAFEATDSQETFLDNDNAPAGDQGELSKKRSLQQVVSIANRKETIRWMKMEFRAHGKKKLLSKAVAHFPEYFCGTYRANHQKASTWWTARNSYLDEAVAAPASLQRNQISKVTRVNLKALAGRDRKQSDWVVHVHAELMDEFLRL